MTSTDCSTSPGASALSRLVWSHSRLDNVIHGNPIHGNVIQRNAIHSTAIHSKPSRHDPSELALLSSSLARLPPLGSASSVPSSLASSVPSSLAMKSSTGPPPMQSNQPSQIIHGKHTHPIHQHQQNNSPWNLEFQQSIATPPTDTPTPYPYMPRPHLHATMRPPHHNPPNHMHALPSPVILNHQIEALDKAFDQAQTVVDAQSALDQSSSFPILQTTTSINATSAQDALAKSAQALLANIESIQDPSLKQSKFVSFIQQLGSGEKTLSDGEWIDSSATTAHLNWAQEFVAESTSHALPPHPTNQPTTQRTNPSFTEWEERLDTLPAHEHAYTERTQSGTRNAGDPFGVLGDQEEQERWAKEFVSTLGSDGTLTNEVDDDAFVRSFNAQQFQAELTQNLMADEARDTQQHSHLTNYVFATENPYLTQSPETLQRLITPLLQSSQSQPAMMMGIADSILALEAAIFQSPSAPLWYALGIRQQENENDLAAIAALTKSLDMDDSLLDSYIALAVSYTNENNYDMTFESLEKWLSQHPSYSRLRPQGPSREKQNLVTPWLLAAARSNPGRELDPDVQGALGVVFNVSSEYDKAIDCFRAALSKRPDDYILWNRLGATLANSNDAASAVAAYDRALASHPTYIRARYNLGIACIQLNHHQEAAEHLLRALVIQNATSTTTQHKSLGIMDLGQSDTIWNTLRTVIAGYLNNPTLAQAAARRDLEELRRHFVF